MPAKGLHRFAQVVDGRTWLQQLSEPALILAPAGLLFDRFAQVLLLSAITCPAPSSASPPKSSSLTAASLVSVSSNVALCAHGLGFDSLSNAFSLPSRSVATPHRLAICATSHRFRLTHQDLASRLYLLTGLDLATSPQRLLISNGFLRSCPSTSAVGTACHACLLARGGRMGCLQSVGVQSRSGVVMVCFHLSLQCSTLLTTFFGSSDARAQELLV